MITVLKRSSPVLVAAAVVGCASGGAATPSAPSAAQGATASGFVREIAPFPVLDADGRAYTHPFLGGLDVPRPQFVDMDGDGDLDLFVQERTGELMHFENVGTPQQARYVWRTDAFQNIDVGEWSRIVDVDDDGDLDVLGEQRYSYVRYFRNNGSPTEPRLELFEDSVKTAEGVALFSDRQNIPQAVDLDCDEQLDLFLGRVDGTITRYEEAQTSTPDPRFYHVTDRFEGIEIIGQLVGSARHGANSMFFADSDGDGDLDLYWGDFFEPGVLHIENTGTCLNPALRSTPRPLMADGDTIATSGYNAPFLADIDADADLDVFLGVLGGAFNPNRTAAENFHFYERSADGGLTLRTARYLDGIDVGSESAPALGDLDGDGDLDILIGSKIDPTTLRSARLFFFRNDGSATAPQYVLADTLDMPGSYHFAPALADLDDDGLLDLLLGTWNEGIQFLRNTGTAEAFRFEQDTVRTIELTRGSNSTPALVDIDADGDLDLFAGEASGELNFFRNNGSASEPRFEPESDVYGGLDAGRRSHPAFHDMDCDGDFDLLLASEAGGVVYFRNDGTAVDPRFVPDASFALPLHAAGSPVFADVDGDGDADLVAGGLSGGLTFWRRQ